MGCSEWDRHRCRAEIRDLVVRGRPSPATARALAAKYGLVYKSIQYDIRMALDPSPRGVTYQVSPKVRAQVFVRDLWTCQYCGSQAHVAEHVVPRSLSGPGRLFNLVAACSACSACNADKGTSVWVPANIHVLAEANALWARFILASAANSASASA